MRDIQIINELSNLKKRNALVYKQMVFCNTRMEAFEKVLAGSAWSRFLFIGWPASFMRAVDKVQLDLMAKHDDELRRKSEEAQKPKIQLVPAGAANGI